MINMNVPVSCHAVISLLMSLRLACGIAARRAFKQRVLIGCLWDLANPALPDRNSLAESYCTTSSFLLLTPLEWI